ncbi:mitochondrial ATP synthase epsilon chain-domain-containing protein [Mrakia frigida]|uniref:ATP synthase subunit epsilon family protein n=1 Tax=Mrakia frigida TaxID=29902 RepID=UPI003FCC070D
MSSWRAVMTYNKYSQVAARAVRSALKEPERIKADKRALVTLKKQIWEKGIPTESKFVDPEQQKAAEAANQKKPTAAV